MSAERPSTFQSGSVPWVLQRVTAAFLVVTLAFHFFLLHFVHHAAEITLAGSAYRMQQLGYLATMLLFLYTATFHGVNGVYGALLNQGITGGPKRAAEWLLAIAGVALAVQGTRLAIALTGVGVSP